MELMSALLLYAFAAITFQQGFSIKTRPNSDIKVNTSLILNPNYGIAQKKLLLNINAPPLKTAKWELNNIFNEPRCKFCVDCMRMALRARMNKTFVRKHKPNDLYYEVLHEHSQQVHHNRKREAPSTDSLSDANSKVTITKYAYENGQIYALKVNDTTFESDPEKTCKIFIVTKSLSCDYSERNLATIARASKKNKKNKPKSKKKTIKSSTPATESRSMQNKRALSIIENSNVPDNFMPSIEEMY